MLLVRCSNNYNIIVLALQQPNCDRVVIFTDSMQQARRSVDPSLHTGQAHSLAVVWVLRLWLQQDANRYIEFIYTLSHGVGNTQRGA